VEALLSQLRWACPPKWSWLPLAQALCLFPFLEGLEHPLDPSSAMSNRLRFQVREGLIEKISSLLASGRLGLFRKLCRLKRIFVMLKLRPLVRP
jgi:hypothetical protein